MTLLPRLCRLHEPAPLEDDLSYVWRKAIRGNQMDAAALAAACGVALHEIESLIAGKADTSLMLIAAECLRLNASAVLKHDSYHPKVPHIHGVHRLLLPFEGDTVNAWLIREEDQVMLFDTGFERDSAIHALQPIGVADLHVMITHDHRDHVGGLAGLTPLVKKKHSLSHGQHLELGSLEIRCLDLSGHCIPTYGYLIYGLSRPLCVVGDALFAGSIGGCPDRYTYEMALRNLHHHVMSLPDDTILLPGHGPATTVGQEKIGNPFLAK
jgi:hypothetical protein